MKIKIVPIKEAEFITHNGSFHSDELFCTAIFCELYDEVKLCRTRSLEGKKENSIIYDIGLGELDHHQKEIKKRNNNIPYAAFGLVWKKYGKEYLKKLNCLNIDELFEYLDNNLITPLDAHDNGVGKKSNKILNICDIVEHINPIFGNNDVEDTRFIEALDIISKILIYEVKYAESMIKGKKEVEEAINNSNNGVMIMNSRLPWEENLLLSINPKSSEILYIIRPGKTENDGYSINAVPVGIGSFVDKLPFPQEWRGKSTEELKKITGINSITFCHRTGFLAVALTFEDAIKCATESIRLSKGKK